MTARKLHVNLSKCIFDTIPEIDQAIVDSDSVEEDDCDYCEEYQQ